MSVGEKFGRLIIFELSHTKNRSRYWKCRCECGGESVVRYALLRNGNTKSCGCIQKEIASIHKINENKSRALALGVAAQRNLYRIYIRNSKKRGFLFDLKFEDFIKLTAGRCYYCNIEPQQIHKKEDFNGCYVYNGIDRVNNNEGYTLKNSVTCCRWCNYSKGNRSQKDFLNWVRLIYENLTFHV